MRRTIFVLALGLLLSGCEGTRAAKFTPLPYAEEDEAPEIIGKTFVNVPVWAVEAVAGIGVVSIYAGFFLGILWIQAGAPGAPQ